MSECPYEADCDATAELCRTLRAEVERLEQALRLHLAVAPDDPILLTPVERQLVAMRQERDEALSMRDFAKEDRDLYYQRWEVVSRERDRLMQENARLQERITVLDTTGRLMEIRAERAEAATPPSSQP